MRVLIPLVGEKPQLFNTSVIISLFPPRKQMQYLEIYSSNHHLTHQNLFQALSESPYQEFFLVYLMHTSIHICFSYIKKNLKLQEPMEGLKHKL